MTEIQRAAADQQGLILNPASGGQWHIIHFSILREFLSLAYMWTNMA